MPAPHPIQRRFHAERLVRRRRADEQQRYAASQRRGRIDPNPHQIDAVIFALRRIPEGGCILADEVGLGKTIEAGLVIAQLLAEGAGRILLIVPKPLLGQWQSELHDLFSIETREGRAEREAFAGSGVFLVGRELAGSERGARVLAGEDFDLCVIDEAHEIFAGIYKRFDRHGNYKADADVANMAHRVRGFLGATPVLLLTATPIQNSLTELWGLMQYIEPTGTLLGKLPTFRQVFIDRDERKLVAAQAEELRRRIATVCQRTLRRQAQEFLEKPFVERRARLFEYTMSPEERALYDDVTAYLLDGDVYAFRGNQRQLLLIGFHRRMASSLPALAASLRNVAARLRSLLPDGDGAEGDAAASFVRDLEDDDLADLTEAMDAAAPPLDPQPIREELARVESFAERAESLPVDGKGRAMLQAVRLILERGEAGEASGRVVIFTESLTTQEYLQQLLTGDGHDPQLITLFRGVNESERAREALARWQEEVGGSIPAYRRPSRSVAMRLALVHEFKTRSRVLIATEAGAKGLNLQFCDSLINYDLPWNPQRIEQRIGRCHRYGQQRPVTVINFLARDNEAQRLTMEILSQKLDLFGTVLDASDHVLHEPGATAPEALATALGMDFELQLRRIYERARSREEIEEDLREMRQSFDERRLAFDDSQQRTASLIENRFDDSVRRVFRRLRDELPEGLAQLDRDLDRLVSGYLEARGCPYRRSEEAGRICLELEPSQRLPEGLRDGVRVALGHARDLADIEPLYLGHPLVQAAVEEARGAAAEPFSVRLPLPASPPEGLAARRGGRGRLVVTKVRYGGFEPVERLLVTALLEGDVAPLPAEAARHLLELAPEDAPPLDPPLDLDPDELDDAVEEALFLDQAEVAGDEQRRFESAMAQIERFIDDQVLILERRRQEVAQRLEGAQKRRDKAMGAAERGRAEEALAGLQQDLDELEAEIARLAARRDPEYEKWRQKAHLRRYEPPVTERLLDVELVLG